MVLSDRELTRKQVEHACPEQSANHSAGQRSWEFGRRRIGCSVIGHRGWLVGVLVHVQLVGWRFDLDAKMPYLSEPPAGHIWLSKALIESDSS